MNEHAAATLESARLSRLAEFRFHLRRFLNFSETEAERFGIAAQQYQLLQVIGALPAGDSASITFLAERMVLRHNSTVELVDRAERAGLVKRISDERDLRRSLVILTEHGNTVLHGMALAHLQQLDGEAGDRMLQALEALRQTSPDRRGSALDEAADAGSVGGTSSHQEGSV